MASATSDPAPGGAEQRRFRVEGRVQGVGFRWWTRREARRLGLSGEVRNRADGSVEVLARGSPAMLAALADSLRRGPGGARVTRIVETPARDVPTGDFEIGD